MVKKLTILSLVFAVLLSCFAGCGANRKEDSTQPQQSAGYVQEEISVPLEDGYSQDMVMLPDGRLWMAVNSTDGKSAVLLTSNEARTEWEKTEALPDEVLASGGVWSVTLSDLGRDVCNYLQGRRRRNSSNLPLLVSGTGSQYQGSDTSCSRYGI